MATQLGNAESYEHSPLLLRSSIRLLDLQPALSFTVPLECGLREVPFEVVAKDDNDALTPEYCALSYVWGSVETTNLIPIYIRTFEGALRRLSITSNCAAALRQLRSSTEVKTMWVDAICIDQMSIAEKNKQIPLMGDLYRRAEQVLMWLDLSDLDGNKTKRVIARLNQEEWLAANGYLGSEQHSRPQRYGWTVMFCQMYCKLVTRVFDDTPMSILENEYFHRAWTAQEFLLARTTTATVVSTYGIVPLMGLLRSIQNVMEDRSRLPEQLMERWSAAANSNMLVGSQLKGGDSLNRFLAQDAGVFRKTQYLRCKDLRDKAYAFFWAFHGKVDENQHSKLHLFNVDYSKSVEQVFTELAAAIVEVFGANILVIICCQRGKRYILPSWVPDWSSPSEDEFFNQLVLDKYQAGGSNYTRKEAVINNSALLVRGILVAIVSRVLRVPRGNDSQAITDDTFLELYTAAYDFYTQVFDEIDQRTASNPAGIESELQGLFEALRMEDIAGVESRPADKTMPISSAEIRVAKDRGVSVHVLRLAVLKDIMTACAKQTQEFPCADATSALTGQEWLEREMERILSPYLSKTRIRGFVQRLSFSDTSVFSKVLHFGICCDGSIGFMSMLVRVISSTSGVVIFTSDGRIGRALDAQEDDGVAIWAGVQCPLIVRKINNEPRLEDVWSLVSATYVTGIMKGEAYDENKLIKFEVR